LRELVARVRPDLIVNAAAYTAVEAAEGDPLAAMAVNGIAPGILAEEASKIGAALVHYSTDYVFGGHGDRAWREEDAPDPKNVYGRTKLAGEEAIRSVGADHLIVRTSWLYAIHAQSFAKKMLELASRQSEISMVTDQIGAPTSARFVADATSSILAEAAGDPAALFRARGGTLHVACAGDTSWYAFAKTIFDQARELRLPVSIPTLHPILSASRPTALPRPLNSRLDTTRLRERFSVVPPSWDSEFRAHFPSLFAQYVLETSGVAMPTRPAKPERER
jgi:dTDP-4-dehydrorhamnose reductase